MMNCTRSLMKHSKWSRKKTPTIMNERQYKNNRNYTNNVFLIAGFNRFRLLQLKQALYAHASTLWSGAMKSQGDFYTNYVAVPLLGNIGSLAPGMSCIFSTVTKRVQLRACTPKPFTDEMNIILILATDILTRATAATAAATAAPAFTHTSADISTPFHLCVCVFCVRMSRYSM